MQDYRDFTVDNISFGGLKEYVDDLYHNKSVKFVPIVDAAIAWRPGYSTFDQGAAMNVYLTMPGSSVPFEGRVWPNEAVFPDFYHPNTSIWWEN
jgi:alpha-glucosidase